VGQSVEETARQRVRANATALAFPGTFTAAARPWPIAIAAANYAAAVKDLPRLRGKGVRLHVGAEEGSVRGPWGRELLLQVLLQQKNVSRYRYIVSGLLQKEQEQLVLRRAVLGLQPHRAVPLQRWLRKVW